MNSIKDQVVGELHRSARKKFTRRSTTILGLSDTYQADLVEMIPYAKQNRNFKYILTVIDNFSKFAWAIPIKDKSGENVTKAMRTIFESGSIPRNLHTDNGKEFYNKQFKQLMKQYKVNLYSTYSTMKAAIVERFNRTLKNKMWKMFTFLGSFKWIDSIQTLVDEYNNTIHRTIKMRPVEVNVDNEINLLRTVYANKSEVRRKPKFTVGTHVRISKYKSLFEKGYTPNWTSEIFKIRKVQNTHPVTYLLKDDEGEDIVGGFYEYELQSVMYPDTFLIEKVLRRKGSKVLVKWLGHDNSHNEWINKKDVI